jgi:hypothetical protein
LKVKDLYPWVCTFGKVSYITPGLKNFLEADAEKLRRGIEEGPSKMSDELCDLIRGLWIPKIPEEHVDVGRVAAVDGGIIRFRLANGGALVVVAAQGIGRGVTEMSSVECSVVYPPHSGYGRLMMKKLELKTGLKMLESLGPGDVLLMDGSLYGLLSTLLVTPRGTPEGYGRLLIEYFTTLFDFLDKAMNNKTLVLFLSKVSSSRYLRDYLLARLFNEEVKKLKDLGMLEAEDLNTVEELHHKVFRKPVEALEYVRYLSKKYGHVVDRLADLVGEGVSKTPDLLLLGRVISGQGYTKPALLGASSAQRDELGKKLSPELVKKILKRLMVDRSCTNMVEEVLKRLQDVYAVISFYAKFGPYDHPLKIDLPCFCLGIENRFFDVYIPEIHDELNVEETLKILSNMYGGPEVYNIWLYQSDRLARLSRREAPVIAGLLDRYLGPLPLARRPISLQ